MKKFATLLVLLFTAVTFTSCSDDDGPGSTADLIGTWESVSKIEWEKIDGDLIYGSEDEVSYASLRIVFDEDGSCSMYNRYGQSGSWVSDGYSYSYKYSGGKLVITDKEDGESRSAKVIKLTETTLVVEEKDSYREDGELYEEYTKVTFKKVS